MVKLSDDGANDSERGHAGVGISSPAALSASLEVAGHAVPEKVARYFHVASDAKARAAKFDLRSAAGAYYGLLSAERLWVERDLRSVANSTTNALLLISVVAGRLEGSTAQVPIYARQGEICILCMDGAVELEASDCEARICVLPFGMVVPHGDHREDWHGFVFGRGSRVTHLLAQTVEQVVDYYFEKPSSTPEDLTGPLAGMVGQCLAIAATAKAAGASTTTHSAGIIAAYILENLNDPDLSVASLANRFGMARASLYRQFHSAGSVAEYIRKQRLQRARLELARNGGGPLNLAALALRWGFKSAAQFSRSFRSVYGISPRAFRREQSAIISRSREGKNRRGEIDT